MNEFMDTLAKLATEYCSQPDVNEDEIDRFIEFVFKNHCKLDLMMLRSQI